MTIITIMQDAKPAADSAPASAPVSITVETGDHIVITRKVDREKHRAALRSLIDGMNSRVYNPNVETASDILEELRNRHV